MTTEAEERLALAEKLRIGATTSIDVGTHIRKYQELCNEAADFLEAIRAPNVGTAEIDRDNAQFNEGVTHTVELLAKLLGVDNWTAGDGSEDYDSDLQQTLLNILTVKGLYEIEDGSWATLTPESANAQMVEALRDVVERLEGTALGLSFKTETIRLARSAVTALSTEAPPIKSEAEIRREERERCAQLAEAYGNRPVMLHQSVVTRSGTAKVIAMHIRALDQPALASKSQSVEK